MKNYTLPYLVVMILSVVMVSCSDNNQLPECDMFTPSDGSSFLIGHVVVISVEAKDVNGEIQWVMFYANDEKIGTFNGYPASINWNTAGMEQGEYTLKVVVIDDDQGRSEDEVMICLREPAVFGNSCPDATQVTDIDGNVYQTVQIGAQCWMRENLRVTRYPDGEPIPYIQDTEDWAMLDDNMSDDAFCYYNNDYNNQYGALYTFAAAIGDNQEHENFTGQGVCPDGWHIPNDEEWKVLESNVDSQYGSCDTEWDDLGWRGFDTGEHLKADNGWNDDGNGDNQSGFSALPGGKRHHSTGEFIGEGIRGHWWSASENHRPYAWNRGLESYIEKIQSNSYYKSSGFAVRCLKDG